MLKTLKRISYKVNDLSSASEWYSGILNLKPVYSSPLLVVYKINNSELVLLPSDQITDKDSSVIVYWEVDDTDNAVKIFSKAGAIIKEEARTILDSRVAKLTDPFGNTFGVTSVLSGKRQILKEQPSQSAMTTLFCRAISAVDEREEIKGPDYLAEIFLPEESTTPLRDKAARKWVLDNILTGGAYEYFIARTAYVDKLFREALDRHIPQIVFLGAGYDSRPYRFSDCIRNTKIFEIDSCATQERKLKLLKKSGVFINSNIVYIPIDFDTEDLEEKLFSAGFDKNLLSFYIWEGVTYYLEETSVYNTLNFIKRNSPAGSILFFDYMLYSEERHNRPEIKDALDRMKKLYKAESVKFMIQENDITRILNENGFGIIEEMMTDEMELKYLKLKDGTISGRIIDLFSFVKAQVM
jgi:methyltransferase (TIGR00027 family)